MTDTKTPQHARHFPSFPLKRETEDMRTLKRNILTKMCNKMSNKKRPDIELRNR